ncbi:MAG: 3-hydroxyacyl-CoA dehydrogenase NAD-binding domain-containing protein [Gammaproteobacteria bacterium]|nr:3-hydroxyacyl-CoA dehydrogenase NAD-binding domain-containing protein [Gammaproteobacteria bacterium]
MSVEITDWKTHTDEDGILWLTLDQLGTSTNVLSISVLQQLDGLLDEISANLPRAVIFRSGKAKGFIAGADVKEFLDVTTIQEALIMIKRGQTLFSRIESLPCPTVAMIEGFCMGGGTELALACDYRVALDDSSTRIGLPEVKLGIHPAYGGLVRSTAMINPLKSLEIMLSGRSLRARAASAIGLVDRVQPQRQIERAARQMALSPPEKRKMPLLGKILSLPGIRHLLAEFMKKQVAKKAPRQHYPAPYAILDVWANYYGNNKRMMEEEANSVARLIQGNKVRSLVRVFFLQTRLKGLGDKKSFIPRHVHVIGAGTMGGDIAAWCALRGFTVTLQDREAKYLGNAFKRAHQLYGKRLKATADRNAALDRLIPDIRGDGVARADVVIEAIFEDIDAKHAIYRDIEARMKPGAVLATNTSSIPLETLASVLKEPDRLVGVHFFNPVAMMPLVEIVKTETSSQETIQNAIAFTQHIGKLPLPVKSSPGFLVNRILMPYLVEAFTLYDEGVAPEAIDKAATDFGMPMGPVELADTVGLDICHSVAENLSAAFGIEVPAGLKKFVESNKLGKKSGRGFYRYKKGKPIKDNDANLDDQKAIQNRLLYRFLNEAAACLQEEIVEDKDLLDAGIIFGTGFAPFRGGPMNYSLQEGVDSIVQSMTEYAGKYGERFSPVDGWSLVKTEA